MLQKQLDAIAEYPQAVRDQLRLVIVDDCGEPPVSVSQFPVETQVFRITTDIPWNQAGARNLGMSHAKGVCLMIDPDMVFSVGMMARMIEAAEALPRKHVTRYALKHVTNGQLDMTSPNTYLIHKEDFDAIGGYDEDFCGRKGWSDVQLLDILSAHYKMHKRSDLFADFYSTQQIPDAAITKLDRNTSANRKIRLKKQAQAKSVGGWKRWVKEKKGPNLRFPWVRVYPPS